MLVQLMTTKQQQQQRGQDCLPPSLHVGWCSPAWAAHEDDPSQGSPPAGPSPAGSAPHFIDPQP